MKNISEMFDLRRRSGGSDRLLPYDGVMMSVQSCSKKTLPSLAIAIGAGVMGACRWVVGDRVTVDLDPAKSEMTLRRVLPDEKRVVSWTLSCRSGEKKTARGTCAATTIKISATPIMLKAFGMEDCERPYIPSPVITGAAGVTFALRKQWTVVTTTRK